MVDFLVVVGISFFSTCAYGNEGKLLYFGKENDWIANYKYMKLVRKKGHRQMAND